MPHFFAKNHPGQGKLFAKKGGVGVFDKIRKGPGYFIDDDSVGGVGGGHGPRSPIFEMSSYVPLKST